MKRPFLSLPCPWVRGCEHAYCVCKQNRERRGCGAPWQKKPGARGGGGAIAYFAVSEPRLGEHSCTHQQTHPIRIDNN